MRLSAASRIGPVLVTALLGVLGPIAFAQVERQRPALQWLAQTPKAALSAPLPKPAIYPGVLRGPRDRASPLKSRAAAYWWWVDLRRGKSYTTVCSGAAEDHLLLADGAFESPLAIEGRDVELTWSGADDEKRLARRTLFDLGTGGESDWRSEIPAAASSCAGANRSYAEKRIPPSTPVEVFGCYEGGVLGPCEGTPNAMIVAVGGIEKHRRERVDVALRGLRPLAIAGTLAILLVLVITLVGQRAVLRGLKPIARKS